LSAHTSQRITLVTNELRGLYPAAGMGTATSFLALALARMGHSVEALVGWQADREMDPYWEAVYAQAGISVRRAVDSGERIEPAHFAVMHDVARALRADPPDVIITHDLGAPAYSALRLRQAGLAFEDSLFVVFCHGTRRWVMEMSRRIGVRDIRDVLATNVLERASIELADVVVSPSAYLICWMRDQGWRLPEATHVIPYFTRSGAIGEAMPMPATTDRLRRLAFFGRLEDKKGLKPFVAGMNAVEPELLRGRELEFVGKTTTTWTRDRIEALLAPSTREALQDVVFATNLDQHEAIERLRRPGTLVVIPSLGDNSPNTVYECLEHGIPFIAGNVGGIPELVDPADRDGVLVEPTPDGIADALRRLLSEDRALRPARPAFDPQDSHERWAAVVESPAAQKAHSSAQGTVDVVVHTRTRRPALDRQTYQDFRVIEAEGDSVPEARATALRWATAPYVLFLDEDDTPDDELLETLVRTQTASGADVVSCAVRIVGDGGASVLHFFSGDPGGLAVLRNDYGTVALIRRALLDEHADPRPAAADPDWPLLARLAAAGAKIVSVPLPLVARAVPPATVERNPADALLALRHLEAALPDSIRQLARVAAGLAANEPRFSNSPRLG
jgi:glycosyltransferase involved in cell wall biosynthesis